MTALNKFVPTETFAYIFIPSIICYSMLSHIYYILVVVLGTFTHTICNNTQHFKVGVIIFTPQKMTPASMILNIPLKHVRNRFLQYNRGVILCISNVF